MEPTRNPEIESRNQENFSRKNFPQEVARKRADMESRKAIDRIAQQHKSFVQDIPKPDFAPLVRSRRFYTAEELVARSLLDSDQN